MRLGVVDPGQRKGAALLEQRAHLTGQEGEVAGPVATWERLRLPDALAAHASSRMGRDEQEHGIEIELGP